MSDTKEVLALLGWAVRHSWDDHHNEDGDGIRALVQRARNQHDAERATIAALKADLARHKRALAAGPAALRAMAADYDRKVLASGPGGVGGEKWREREDGIIRSADLINAALHVESAQIRAMEEG